MSAKLGTCSPSPNVDGEGGNALPQLAYALPPAASVRVTADIWGLTVDDQGHAEREAQRGWSRCAWTFVAIRRSIGDTCLLNLRDGTALAAVAGSSWAYVVYPARCAVSLAQTYQDLRAALASLGASHLIGEPDV